MLSGRRFGKRQVELRSGFAISPHCCVAEIAGPREESLIAAAKLLTAQQGNGLRIEAGEFFEDPEGLYPAGAVLPGPIAKLAGPTFEEWLGA